MSSAPLVPGPVYGLRTWTIAGDRGNERLAGPQRGTVWPGHGEWLEASCASGHAAPAEGCGCAAHAWHPILRWARRTVASRREIGGIVEGSGAIEVHADGFRAQRARPHALVQVPVSNPALLRRLAAEYEVPVVEVRGARELLAWCRERGLGLDEAVVAKLLSPAPARPRWGFLRRTRASWLRIALLTVAMAVLLAFGLQPDPKGDRILYGRTGPIHVHH